jgi:predicted Zn-dependent peptidase
MLKTPLDAALLEIKLGFLLESLIGKQSANYHALIEKALANDSLDFLGSVEPTFGFFRITTETRKIDGTVEALRQILAKAASTPISEEQFLASRNRMIGSFYRSFNRIDGVASVFSDYLAKDVDVEALMEASLAITIEDIVELSKAIADASLSVLIHHPDGAMNGGANRVKMI